MRVARCISILRPMTSQRGFGCLNSGWPLHREGGRARSGFARRDRKPRYYRAEHQAEISNAVTAPIHLAVTNLTLCPRLTLNWSAYCKAKTRLENHIQNATYASVTVHENANHAASELHNTTARELRQIRHETLLEKVSRVFLSGRQSAKEADAVRAVAKPQATEVSSRFRLVDVLTPLRGRLLRSENTVLNEFTLSNRRTSSQRRLLSDRRVTWHHQHNTRSLQEASRLVLDRVLSTHVVRRVFNRRNTEEEIALPHGDPRLIKTRRALPEHFASNETAYAADRPARTPNKPNAFERQQKPPAGRTFRSPPDVPEPQPVVSVPTRTPTPVPEIDFSRLDKELWRRFEKRLRVEHERRGRG